MLDQGFDFSFSGLKTAVINHVRKHPDVEHRRRGAPFQEAVVDVLVAKARRAAEEIGAKGCASAVGSPPTRCCGSASSTPARRTAVTASCRAGDVHRQRRRVVDGPE